MRSDQVADPSASDEVSSIEEHSDCPSDPSRSPLVRPAGPVSPSKAPARPFPEGPLAGAASGALLLLLGAGGRQGGGEDRARY